MQVLRRTFLPEDSGYDSAIPTKYAYVWKYGTETLLVRKIQNL
ncbi:hypothetical protein [Leptospira alstonii]